VGDALASRENSPDGRVPSAHGDLIDDVLLTQLAADIRETLKADAGPATKAKVCATCRRRSRQNLGRHPPERPRERCPSARGAVRRSELGFCICGHVTTVQRTAPHDHGSSWAIYGQAVGVTEMTGLAHREERRGRGAFAGRARQDIPDEPRRRAPLRRRRSALAQARRAVKLIRVEGKNLDHVKRSNIKAK